MRYALYCVLQVEMRGMYVASIVLVFFFLRHRELLTSSFRSIASNWNRQQQVVGIFMQVCESCLHFMFIFVVNMQDFNVITRNEYICTINF